MVTAPAQPDALLGWMECLADPTRLRLLRLLERHELGVVELCDILQLPQSTVSRHLKVLAEQAWVAEPGQGTTHLYRMTLDEADPAARRLWLLAREQTDGWATVRQDELRLRQRLLSRETDSQAFFAGAAGEWDKPPRRTVRPGLRPHGPDRAAAARLDGGRPRLRHRADAGGTGPVRPAGDRRRQLARHAQGRRSGAGRIGKRRAAPRRPGGAAARRRDVRRGPAGAGADVRAGRRRPSCAKPPAC